MPTIRSLVLMDLTRRWNGRNVRRELTSSRDSSYIRVSLIPRLRLYRILSGHLLCMSDSAQPAELPQLVARALSRTQSALPCSV